ncbi:putative ABC transporter permease [Butyricicoccus faecihominis]|uniref:putative ABC transporter permease n=2 Tax=Butyricicoccaceae TaxID=3085642 RepID=UPI0024793A69|nr:putative ABC transporter permease [Butyricicoccus faecihominis]MCQ5130551.1 putative ABC transporter permease [Butyricicoccus faecihominis]
MIGGVLYMGVEMLWRGKTHWTMGVLGGLCFVLIGLLNETRGKRPPLLLQMIEGAFIVTALELAVGLIVNTHLGWNVWDYSDMPFNFLGQITPQFTFAWFFLSAAAVWLEDRTHVVLRDARDEAEKLLKK